jgi:hypothetical protein
MSSNEKQPGLSESEIREPAHAEEDSAGDSDASKGPQSESGLPFSNEFLSKDAVVSHVLITAPSVLPLRIS